MEKVIDCACDVSSFVSGLRNAGVETVMRYYNEHNSSSLPTKCLTKTEAQTLAAAGIRIGVVFEQGGGANGNIGDFNAEMASANVACALERAQEVGQPHGSAIYFAVDHDFTSAEDLAAIKAYFKIVSGELRGRFKCGVYGSGMVSQMLLDVGLVDFVWLTQSTGWSGSQAMLQSNKWALAQGSARTWSDGAFGYDPNRIGKNWPQFGQFTV